MRRFTAAAVAIAALALALALALAAVAMLPVAPLFGDGWDYFYTQLVFDLPGRAVADALQGAGWMPGTYLLMAVVPWLVRRDPLPRRARPVVAVAGAFAVVVPVLVLFDRLIFAEDPPPVWAGAELVYLAGQAVIVLVGLWAAADAALRWRRASRLDRRGLGWLVIGTAVLSIAAVPMVRPFQWATWLVEAGMVPLAPSGNAMQFSMIDSVRCGDAGSHALHMPCTDRGGAAAFGPES
jgi:hypothetical protein